LPRKEPEYNTVELTGGLGDCIYMLFNGPYACWDRKVFVINNSSQQGTMTELLGTSPNVARVIEAHARTFSLYPPPQAPAHQIEIPLLEGESLRPPGKYIVLHAMSSSDKDIETPVVQLLCDQAYKMGLFPVLVGKDCYYDYSGELFTEDNSYFKAESLHIKGAINLLNHTNLRQLFDLVRHAEFVIGTHSAVAQMAWATGVPCFCIMPDYLFLYWWGRPQTAFMMYHAPLFRDNNGFMFVSDLSLLDRFYAHFLRKNGYHNHTTPRNPRFRTRYQHATRIHRVCRQEDAGEQTALRFG